MRGCQIILLQIALLLSSSVCAMDEWTAESIAYLENRYSIFLEDMPNVEEINRRADEALRNEPDNVHLLYLKGRTEHLLLSMKVILHKRENTAGSALDEDWYKTHFEEYVNSYRKALELDSLGRPDNTLVAEELVGMSGGVILPPDVKAKVTRLILERVSPRGEDWYWNQYTAMVTAYHSANQFSEAQSVLDEMLEKFPSRQEEILKAKQSIAQKEQAYQESLESQDREDDAEIFAEAPSESRPVAKPDNSRFVEETSQTKKDEDGVLFWVILAAALLALIGFASIYVWRQRRR